MKNKSSNWKFILTLLCWCSMAATLAWAQEKSPAQVIAPFAGATISDFRGKVGVQLPNQASTAPARGETLPAETVITTDAGRVLLQIQDGSEVLVRPHTRVVLKQPATGDWRYIQLLVGRIRAEIQKRFGGSPPFQIGTPSAVISVRGTQFDVEVNQHQVTEVDVQEGAVQLEGTNAIGAPVLITAGLSSRVGLDSAPEAPRPTEDLRPEVERPDRNEEKEIDRDRDNLMEKLRSDDRQSQEKIEEQSAMENEKPSPETDSSN